MRFAFLLLSFHLIVFHAENLSGSVKGFERSVVKIILRCHIQRFCAFFQLLSMFRFLSMCFFTSEFEVLTHFDAVFVIADSVQFIEQRRILLDR